MQSTGNTASSSNVSPTDSPTGGITIPPLNGNISHIRQKPSRIGLGERQYSYDITTGPSVRVMPRSNPSPPPVHARQYSEGAVGDKATTPVTAMSTRNASISSLDTTQFGTLTSLEGPTQSLSGGRRRHGHSHSHAIPHHHVPTPVAKPASMMSIPLPT